MLIVLPPLYSYNLFFLISESIMKYLLIALTLSLPMTTFAGNCDNSWQSAKDGSSCGDRAADRRPGGR